MMNEISTFVQTIYDYFDRMGTRLEEDQQLPPYNVLEKICHILLNVSTMPEELRYPSFRVCFIDPNSDLLDVYLYSHTLLFEEPIDFNMKELHRLAPALNADMSYLMLDISDADYKIIGINASYTTWENIIVRESTSGNRMPKIPNIYLKGPGALDACLGESTLVSYRSGICGFFRTDTFTSSLVADELRNGSSVSEENRLKVLYRILWKIQQYSHGGHLYIVPSEESCKRYVSIKYRLPSAFAFGSMEKLSYYPNAVSDKAIITYADLLAKLTAIDGAVILNKDLDLIGFGAEIIISNSEHGAPQLRFIGYNNEEKPNKRYNDNGMRHRACYRFCHNVENSVAIIMSQDGSVESCTRKDGKVIVYDSVALPLL